MTTLHDKEGISLYVAITLKVGLQLYSRTGMKPNRDWTPTAMLRTAGKITGKTFKARDYASAIAALTEWIERKRADYFEDPTTRQ